MSQDFVGRVERLPLPPSEANSLMPLYEAVSNGLHAVDDRLAAKDAASGRVTVEVLRADGDEDTPPVVGFRVTDDGIGLNADNYRSFLRPDTRHKQARGGKGVGRLGWLKVFDRIRVDSTFREDGKLDSRSFDFRLAEENQVDEKPGRPGPPPGPGTVVTLQDFRPAFSGKCPLGPETIKQRLIAHFLPHVVVKGAVPISVVDGGVTTVLADHFSGHVKAEAEAEVRVTLGEEEHAFTVRHARVSKAMKPERGNNSLFLCANGRTVERHAIDNSLGLGLLDAEDVYVGCVSGKLLDDHVNAERTAFTLDPEVLRDLRQAVMNAVNEFLRDYVERMKADKRRQTQALLREYPQFLFVNEDLDAFVGSLKPGATGREDIYLELARLRFRRQREVTTLRKKIAKSGPDLVKGLVDRYAGMVTSDQKGALAEYVMRRKSVLDVLDDMRAYADEEGKKDHREDALHALVCPMRTDSTKVSYEDHNLWLLDDRLAFFGYFNSDRPLKTYVDAASDERPDLAFFYDTTSAWVSEGAGANTVLLVEFKRPGRTQYDGNENPVRQLIEYVDILRDSANLRDHKGTLRPMRLKNAAYHCYVVADLTEQLLRALKGYNLNPTPDGLGRFGHVGSDEDRFFVEIIPYEKLLTDAKQRNAIFFDKLGLTHLDARTAPPAADEPTVNEAGLVEGDEPESEELVDT